ncbi:MAG: hypothetical protein AAGI69_27505 [Cyanobacteria bacterium P01_H01_bin.21]
MTTSALENALILANRVQDISGYEYTLEAFTAKFRDGHVGAYLMRGSQTEERQYEWPGFVMAWRSHQGIVHSALDEQADLVNAEVISCDNRPIREVVLTNAFRFGGNPSVPGDWIESSPEVFIDGGNPFINRPEQCTFLLPNGVQDERKLQWSSISEPELVERYLLMTDGPAGSPSLEIFGESRYWISVATLWPNNTELTQLEMLIHQIEDQRASLQNADTIVFDLRRATGGSSVWMTRIANALWGETYVNSQSSDLSTYTEYRASQGNLEHLKTLLNEPSLVNAPANVFQFFTETVDGIEQAYIRDEPLYSTKNNPSYRAETVSANSNDISNPVSAKIYVFMTGLCGSACLDAVDLLSQFDNVTLVGMPTSADTDYLEIRDVVLPSERAILRFPIKVYRDRNRPSNFYYEPEILYSDLDLSRAAVESWLTDLINENAD